MKLLQLVVFVGMASSALAQSIGLPWSGHGHDPQHTGLSQVASQPLGEIKWQTPMDLNRRYTGTSLLIHYGTPLITRQNTVIFPVKTGFDDGFKVEARNPVNGALKWTATTDYSLPAHNWVPAYGMALTPKNRLYFPAAGARVNYRDLPDAASGPTGQIAFYGTANSANFDDLVKINTPITSDRYGNIYFGFEVTAVTDPPLDSGIARIAEDGTCSWLSVKVATADNNVEKVVHNCAPALSNDQKTLYFAANGSGGDFGYLVSIDSRTLAPIAKVRLKDARKPGNDASLPNDGSTSPTVGPDGDVYFGVLENPFLSNHVRGWLLHFDSSLTQLKTPGAFGWDDTASIVPASLVPHIHGNLDLPPDDQVQQLRRCRWRRREQDRPPRSERFHDRSDQRRNGDEGSAHERRRDA